MGFLTFTLSSLVEFCVIRLFAEQAFLVVLALINQFFRMIAINSERCEESNIVKTTRG